MLYCTIFSIFKSIVALFNKCSLLTIKKQSGLIYHELILLNSFSNGYHYANPQLVCLYCNFLREMSWANNARKKFNSYRQHHFCSSYQKSTKISSDKTRIKSNFQITFKQVLYDYYFFSKTQAVTYLAVMLGPNHLLF